MFFGFGCGFKGTIDRPYEITLSTLLKPDPVSFVAKTHENYGGEKMETQQDYYRNPKVGEL